mgnify:CR=1 FL=1
MAQKVKMKIVDYDVESESLIVCFASDCSKKHIDEYQTLAYQPTMFDNPEDTEDVLKQIAKVGLSVAEQQDKEDNFRENKFLETKYKEFIGKELEYDAEELIEYGQEVSDPNQMVIEEESEIEEILNEIIDSNEEIDLDQN